ncbi:MAG: recombinase RecA [Thermovirgaceae bacterium]|nr:recombinase RecA [Thermovirgaceae bacterium]
MGKRKGSITREDVLDQALSDIRGKFGEGAIMCLGEGTGAVAEVISTGVLPLDIALGIGGYPRGRIVEVFGPEGGGKTTLALHALAEAQKSGGIAAFIDAEHAMDPRLAYSLGVKLEDLYVAQPDSGEQALYILETLVRSGAVDVIVVDSVAALTPQAEIDGKIGDSQVGLQARLMSYALRRLTSAISKSNCVVIFINQLRAKISTTGYGGPQETTTGGRALKFYSSLRIEVKRGKSITRGDEALGHELWIKVVKNKLAPPFRTAHASLIYGKGIPMEVSLIDISLDYDVLKRKGSWISYKGETLGQGKESVGSYLLEHAELMEEIVSAVKAKAAEGLGFIAAVDDDSDTDGVDLLEKAQIEIEEGILDIKVEEEEK